MSQFVSLRKSANWLLSFVIEASAVGELRTAKATFLIILVREYRASIA